MRIFSVPCGELLTHGQTRAKPHSGRTSAYAAGDTCTCLVLMLMPLPKGRTGVPCQNSSVGRSKVSPSQVKAWGCSLAALGLSSRTLAILS